MNGRSRHNNRHNQYKRQVYARHGAITVIISVAATLAAVILILFIIGNILHAQSIKRNSENTGDTEMTETSGSDNKADLSPINGYPVLLETSDTTVFYDRVSANISLGRAHVSIPLNTQKGSLLYKSAIADKIGYQHSKVSLSDAIASIEGLGAYISGVYYVTAFSEEDPLLRSVKLSQDAAVIAEALNSGLGDVVIVAPEMTEAHIDEAIRLAESIRALAPSGAIGLTVSNSIFEGENASASINKLDSGLDFLAMDASEYGETAPDEYLNESINSGRLIYLHMYKMRILLPQSPDEASQDKITSVANENGMNNWQIIYKIQ